MAIKPVGVTRTGQMVVAQREALKRSQLAELG